MLKQALNYLDELSGIGNTGTFLRRKEAYTANDTFSDGQDRLVGVNLNLRVFYGWNKRIDDVALPDRMQIDYLRVYQK